MKTEANRVICISNVSSRSLQNAVQLNDYLLLWPGPEDPYHSARQSACRSQFWWWSHNCPLLSRGTEAFHPLLPQLCSSQKCFSSALHRRVADEHSAHARSVIKNMMSSELLSLLWLFLKNVNYYEVHYSISYLGAIDLTWAMPEWNSVSSEMFFRIKSCPPSLRSWRPFVWRPPSLPGTLQRNVAV